MTRILRRLAILLLIAAPVGAQTPAPAAAAPAPGAAAETAVPLTDDTVLVRNARATVTKGDYDTELLRVPANIRPGFGTSPERVDSLLNNLWITKSLAAAAREQGLDKDRDVQRRIVSEIDRTLAAAMVERIDIEAGREFDARAGMDQVARERYIVNAARYQTPEQVSATHILFEVPKHPSEEAKKLAAEARARIVAGANMNALAVEISEDPSARRNEGKLDWFVREKMDPAFSGAAFALKKVGDLSEPVESRFGWHLIRLDGRRAGAPRPFEEVKAEIIDELRRNYIEERRASRIAQLRDNPRPEVNAAAIDQLVVRPSAEAIRKATEAAKP